ncbi:hypothetical protein ACFWZ4_13065 [Frateuria sp. GZRe12]|uniref:hypothetical protein n=1 Tax=Frateuria sp. GZRe12 TaxID=3351533 RepID=UPI003EDC6C2E
MASDEENVVPDVQYDPSAMLNAIRDYMRRSGVGGFLLEDPDGKFLVAAEPDLKGLHGLVKSQLQWERRHRNRGTP